MILRKVGELLTDCTASHPRKRKLQTLSCSHTRLQEGILKSEFETLSSVAITIAVFCDVTSHTSLVCCVTMHSESTLCSVEWYDDELERIWKKATMTFRSTSQHLPGTTKEGHDLSPKTRCPAGTRNQYLPIKSSDRCLSTNVFAEAIEFR
jgi:hypothetical protein